MESRTEGKGACLIAGCGYTGTRLARRWLEGGPVLALVRGPASAAALLGLGIPAIAMDFDAEGPSLALPPDLRAVIYLAPPGGGGTEDLRLARFLRALGPAHPQVLVYLSTTGVYGDTQGAPVDEASPLAPQEDRSKQRRDAERRVAAWCEERNLRWVVFRVPAIYGPHRLPLDRLQRGEPVLRAEDSGPGNRIHVDDLVAACLAALERPVSGAFNLTDGVPESMAAFTARVAALAGLPTPRRVSWAEAQTLLSPGLLAFLRESRRVTSRRAQELGWAPTYGDPDDGIRASLEEMGWGS
ncbi:MAG: NAD-dependent epimerase/dehydratase family protein [Holophagaceae bacterium]|nr:NAD-dependent epimerase/dehydratase family protein [Holophagaceae bacterium]